MAAKTAAELKAFATSLNVDDEVTVKWRLVGESADTTWKGKVVTKVSAHEVSILYAGNGEHRFPPTEGSVEVYDMTKTSTVTLSMTRARQLSTGAALNPLDISSWGPYLKDEGTLMIFMTRMKEFFLFDETLPLHTSEGRTRANREFHYEKERTFMLLEAICRERLGPVEGYNRPPLLAAPTLILHTLQAFKVNLLEKGSVRRYIAAVKASKEPKEFSEARKAALKRDPKNEDAE